MFKIAATIQKRWVSSVLNQHRECFVEIQGKLSILILYLIYYLEHTAFVFLNRPSRKNAFGHQMVRELKESIDFVSQNQ
jgi:hypothetical protein